MNNLKEDKRYVPDLISRLCSKLGLDYYNTKRLGKIWDPNGNITGFYIDYDYASKYETEQACNTFANRLVALGAKNIKIKKREERIYFTLDTSNIAAEVAKDEADAEAEYAAELNAIDIDQYKPKQAILDKLMARRASGGHENVKAIYRAGNFDKLLTYYYAAAIIGWKDLQNDIEDCLGWRERDNFEDTFAAINTRVAADTTKIDTRSKDLSKFQNMFRNVANYLNDHNIKFTFDSRKPNSSELDKDARNGRCWTIGYRLSFPDFNDEYIDFCHHTSESVDGGDYGWGYHGYTGDYGKKEIESRLMQDIRRITGLTEEFSGSFDMSEAFKELDKIYR